MRNTSMSNLKNLMLLDCNSTNHYAAWISNEKEARSFPVESWNPEWLFSRLEWVRRIKTAVKTCYAEPREPQDHLKLGF
jgi:hypothetical protein